MPILLRLAMILGAFFGTIGTAAGLVGLLGAVLGGGPFIIHEEVVSRSEFLIVAVPFLVMYVVACLTAGAASWALLRRRTRSRILLAALLVEFAVGDAALLALAYRMSEVTVSELAASALVFALLAVAAIWYLFSKQSVSSYYESIASPLGTPTPHNA